MRGHGHRHDYGDVSPVTDAVGVRGSGAGLKGVPIACALCSARDVELGLDADSEVISARTCEAGEAFGLAWLVAAYWVVFFLPT